MTESIYKAGSFKDDRIFIKNLRPKLAEVGRIKIGRKGKWVTSQKGKRFQKPEKFDHFKITTNQRDEQDNFIVDTELMHKLDPEQGAPTVLPIQFLFDDSALNLTSMYSYYQGKRRYCWGNGEHALRTFTNQSGGDYEKQVECPCELLEQKKCKPYGILRVMLPAANIVGGVYVFRTTSWNSIQNMYGAMEFVRLNTIEAGGILTGIDFHLRLIPKTVTPENKSNLDVFVVSLEYPGTLEELREIAYERAKHRALLSEKLARIEQDARRLIESQVQDSVEEAEDITGEFYPENQGREIPFTDQEAPEEPESVSPTAPPSTHTAPKHASPPAENTNEDQDDLAFLDEPKALPESPAPSDTEASQHEFVHSDGDVLPFPDTAPEQPPHSAEMPSADRQTPPHTADDLFAGLGKERSR